MDSNTTCARAWFRLLPIAGISIILTACAREKPVPIVPPREVSVIRLADSDPATTLRLPGSVAPWKQEDFAFQVAGRVDWVIEEDTVVQGPQCDESYEPLDDGQVIARLDTSRYDAALASAEANLVAASAQVVSTRVQATDIIGLDVGRALTEVTRSKAQLERIKRAVANKAAARSEEDNAQAAYDTAVANVATAKARKTTLEGDLDVFKAKELQAKEAVNQAQIDLDDTELNAPFEARVSKVHATPGTIVAAGTPIATLMVMDPVKVEVVVSAARDRQVKTNDEVLVHTDASPEPIRAIVYQKSAAASATTRTFTLTLLCRNRRVESLDQTDVQAVPISGFMRPQVFDVDGAPTWFVEEQCIHSSEGGHHGWRVINPDGRSEDEPLDLQRIDLKLGEARKNLLGIYRFRQLIPDGEMADALNDSGQGDGRWRMVLAAGVPIDYAGGKVIKTSRRWMLRPGDIVDVQLDVQAPPRGIYVTKKYIRVEGHKYFVFLVDEGGGKPTAKKVPIDIIASVGDLHRIEGADIQVGSRMITSGTHYLQDGTEIQIFESTQ